MSGPSNSNDRAEQIASLRPFASLTPETRLEFVRRTEFCSYGAGEVLRTADQTVDDALFVVAGQVKVVTHRLDEDHLILGIFGPRHPAGGLGLFGETYPGRIESISTVETAEITPERFRNLLSEREEGVQPFLDLASQRTSYLSQRLHDATVQPAERRLALLFQMFQDKWGRSNDDGGVLVPLKIRRRDIADLINTRTETAIRLVRDWERSGLIRTESDGFVIAQPDELEARAAAQ